MKARIKFRKYGVMRFIGHLDVMRYFQKAMRRAHIPIAFTGGYSPHMIMSFAQPLGVGLTSDGEYLDIELSGFILCEEALRRLNQVMVEGIEVTNFRVISEDKKQSGMTVTAAAAYEVSLLKSGKSMEETLPIPGEWKERAEAFLEQETIPVWKKTKKSEKEVDIRPMILGMQVEEDRIRLMLAAGSEANLKPDLLMETFLAFLGREKLPFHYHRMDLYARDEAGELESLEALYEETGSKATIDDIFGVIGKLQSKLKDPLNGYKDNIVALINSRYSGLERPFKGSYDTAANKHRKLVDQISAAYHRKVANDVIFILSEARKTL